MIQAQIGTEYLSNDEKERLTRLGFDLEKLYKESTDPLLLQYQLGMISRVIGKQEANKISMSKLMNIVREGKHIPMTERERRSLDSVKRQSLGDIRALGNRIFTDVNNSILSAEKDNRQAYEEVIRKEIERGTVERKSRRQIAQDLGNKTGDWARNFNRIVQYVSHQAFSEGRIAVQERKYGEEGRIWMDVYPGACKHCIKNYLTKGLGSKPKVFTVKELKANGTNIGRKAQDYKAVIPPLHPHCRCTPNFFDEGDEWDDEKQDFIVPKDKKYESKIRKNKIQVTFNGTVYEV